ncbi:MAG: nuclear transport factor 2 family protein [Bacteroidetes bacterium]|nr:nuclear transport factor 2 family protein [Bacteroidota bacterium]
MKHILCLLLLSGLSLFSQNHKDAELIRKAMQTQQESWNKGDIEGFMAYYWKSDSLKFIGSKGITYGWQNTLNNYKKGYPTQEAMGQLVFEINSIEELSKTSAFVIGKWTLHKKDKDVGGYYTLLWKKIDGHWVIVTDHTS